MSGTQSPGPGALPADGTAAPVPEDAPRSRRASTVPAPGPATETILVRANVRNRDGEEGVRHVELSQFRLWQYFVANRHGLEVTSAYLGLWMPHGEYERLRDFYERAGTVAPVDRIRIVTYDAELGVAHHLVRYVPTEEAETGLQRLLARLGPERAAEGVERERVPGTLVLRRRVDDLRRLEATLADG
jgi:hypothetical protein